MVLGQQDVERAAPDDLPVPEHFGQAAAQPDPGAAPCALQEHRGGQVGLRAGESVVRRGGRRYRLGGGTISAAVVGGTAMSWPGSMVDWLVC